jgi:hypothetical protein
MKGIIEGTHTNPIKTKQNRKKAERCPVFMEELILLKCPYLPKTNYRCNANSYLIAKDVHHRNRKKILTFT